MRLSIYPRQTQESARLFDAETLISAWEDPEQVLMVLSSDGTSGTSLFLIPKLSCPGVSTFTFTTSHLSTPVLYSHTPNTFSIGRSFSP